MAKITTGHDAIDFTLPTDGDGTFTLSQLAGKPVVLFFYPKDDTTGCTKEAIEFTERIGQFAELGCEVAGMSPDPVKKHEKFKNKHSLEVTLVSDEDKSVLEAYGVWVKKSMYGREYMGVERTTLLIGPDGKIAAAWHKVKVPGHAQEVLETARQMFG